jgi:hypothetical protein
LSFYLRDSLSSSKISDSLKTDVRAESHSNVYGFDL